MRLKWQEMFAEIIFATDQLYNHTGRDIAVIKYPP